MDEIPNYMYTWRLLRIDVPVGDTVEHFFTPVPYGMEKAIIHTAMTIKGSVHEVIRHSPFRYYFDCEHKYPNKSLTNERSTTIIKSILDFLHSYDDQWLVFTACASYKFSIHVYSVNRLTSDFKEIAAVAKDMNAYLQDLYGVDFIDVGVYHPNASLRIPYSTTTSGERRLIPYQHPALSIPAMFITPKYEEPIAISQKVEVQLVDPALIPDGLIQVRGMLKNIHPWYCPVCSREHTSDNARLIKSKWGYRFYCFRACASIPLDTRRQHKCVNLELDLGTI